VIIRLIFPYFFLLLIVLVYLYYRYLKLGPVLLKVKRELFTRYNVDSLFLIIIIAAASYFLARFELQSTVSSAETLPLGPLTYVYFYGALILVVILREIERPAFREKGISSSRGFWLWQDVDSFRWSKNILTLNIIKGKRKRAEAWQIDPSAKKEIDQVLKKMVPKRTSRPKKKG
jgi:hypothetical protein